MIPIVRTETGKEVNLGDIWRCSSAARNGDDAGGAEIKLLGVNLERKIAAVSYRGQMFMGEILITEDHPNFRGQKIALLAV